MAKIKEALINDMSSYDIEAYLYNRHLRDAEYEDWLNSVGYVQLVNDEIENSKVKYSNSDVSEAVCYAFDSVQVTQSEVGSDVYSKLIYDGIFEYLNK